jgi:hypothetical protein
MRSLAEAFRQEIFMFETKEQVIKGWLQAKPTRSASNKGLELLVNVDITSSFDGQGESVKTRCATISFTSLHSTTTASACSSSWLAPQLELFLETQAIIQLTSRIFSWFGHFFHQLFCLDNGF